MNRPILPWSLKGVSRAARDAAKEAARREGVPLGVWLSRVIRETGARENEAAPAAPADDGNRNSIERAVARLETANGSGQPH